MKRIFFKALHSSVFSILIYSVLISKLSAQTIEPYRAKEIESYQAKEIKEHRAEEVKPAGSKEDKTQKNTLSKTPSDYFFGTYQYWVPGTSYAVADYTNRQLVLRNSAGTGVLPGSLRINADGTYVWNSSYDKKIIKGNWRKTGDSEYPIELIKAQEGKNWKIGKGSGKGVSVIIWDGSTWYNGRNIKDQGKR